MEEYLEFENKQDAIDFAKYNNLDAYIVYLSSDRCWSIAWCKTGKLVRKTEVQP